MTTNIFDLFNVTVLEVNSVKLLGGDIRFNADYFLTSNNITYNENVKFNTLSNYAKVVFPGIFKRIIVYSPEFGVPFITTSGMMEYSPEPEKYLSKALTSNLQIFRVEEDWILVSRSGTIGNCVFTSKNLTKFAITEDALRVIPNDKKQAGFLYFYISSNYGRDLIVGKKGGAVIDHIYEDDLMSLPVPVVSEKIIVELQEKYKLVKSCREEANDLLQEANGLLYKYNNLPSLNCAPANIIDDPENSIHSRVITSSSINGEFRLDAHFYNPVAELAVENIKKFSSGYQQINEVTEKIFYLNRFTRTFVEKDYGVPYLAGKDIIKIRPSEMSFLSKQETDDLSKYSLGKGWILLSCSGTIGRTCFIWENYEQFVATHDIIRIVPNSNIDPGYLNAFLSSDYGYHQIVKYKHGAVIDHITPEQVDLVTVPIASNDQQKIIGDKVRLAYEKRAEAIRLEDEAQEILKQALTD